MIVKRKWPWIAQQNWEDVLFIHTPIPHTTLRAFVPYPFQVDTYNSIGWVSIVLFRATHSRLRTMPEFSSYPGFFQMNVRTYVRFGKERGVYFFSINVNDRLVQLGGKIASMPFSKTHMTMQEKDDAFHFTASDLFDHPKSTLKIIYKPSSPPFTPYNDSLAHFLTERYCIWMYRGNTIVKAPIFHSHWELEKAEMAIKASNFFPFPVTNDTIAHYAGFKHAYIHPFEKVGLLSNDTGLLT